MIGGIEGRSGHVIVANTPPEQPASRLCRAVARPPPGDAGRGSAALLGSAAPLWYMVSRRGRMRRGSTLGGLE